MYKRVVLDCLRHLKMQYKHRIYLEIQTTIFSLCLDLLICLREVPIRPLGCTEINDAVFQLEGQPQAGVCKMKLAVSRATLECL